MGTRDPRVDEYIENAAPFARPILTEIRARVHKSCPDVVETIKWRNVSFEHHGMLAGMASFKEHCAFGFWKHDLVVGAEAKAKEAMGSFGRITKLSDLPSKAEFGSLVKKAVQLNVEGVKNERPKNPQKKIAMPAPLATALAKNKKAKTAFDAFSPSKQREYMEWIGSAKQDDTRRRRLEQAIAWISEGKSRNWKYEKC
jgi:uncharacterized protein YdeI (YjbR/CyaY-like superfamily)